MRPTILPTQTISLIKELQELPSNHSDGELCPHVRAQQICQRYIDEFITDYSIEAALRMEDFCSLLRISTFINAQYQDGRSCPWAGVHYLLKNFYTPIEEVRHKWHNEPTRIRDLLAMGLIELDAADYKTLAAFPITTE